MEDRGDFWIPKPKRSHPAKKPSLKKDDKEDDLSASKLQKAPARYQNSEFLADPLDKRMAGKTTYLPSSHHDRQPENTTEVLRSTHYGNRPKWSPFADKFNGEIDPLALKRYYDSFKNLQKLSSSNNSHKLISQPARNSPSAQPLRRTPTTPFSSHKC
jgi:hypothetical protein